MQVRVMDRNFNFLGDVDEVTSIIFTRKYSKSGSFEITCPVMAFNSDKFVKDNILFLDADGRESGEIIQVEIKEENDGEIYSVKGLTLDSFFNRRSTIPTAGQATDAITSNAETVLKHYVINNCTSPVDSDRIIPNLIVATNLGRGISTSYNSRYEQLDEELTKISTLSGMGFEVYLDLTDKKFVFDVIEGKNRTVNQVILPPVIFSMQFDNVSNQEYVNSNVGFKNMSYVGGQGEGIARTIVEVGGTLTGLNRRETFIDARDVKELGDLTTRGQQKLTEFGEIKTFNSEITNTNFIYKTDWNLGDIVTIQNRNWGLTMDTRITEVKEIYEKGGYKIEATFGNDIPTFSEKLKKIINKPLSETANTDKYDSRYYTQAEADTMVANKVVTSTTTPSSPFLGQVWINI